jgi:hypothetical protein
MPLAAEVKTKVITDYKLHKTDSGSSEVQVAILSHRIKQHDMTMGEPMRFQQSWEARVGVALADAIQSLLDSKVISRNPLTGRVASVSVGIYKGTPVLDLDYPEDCNAETDMNVVMSDAGDFIEVQGTAEGHPFSQNELNAMLELARKGITELLASQQQALAAQ